MPSTRALSDLPSGRLALKTLSKKVKKELSRVDQRHRASQLRKQKKEAVSEAGIGGWCGFTTVLGTRKCGPGKGPGMETNPRAHVRRAGLDSD